VYLTKDQIAKLPSVVYTVEGYDGSPMEIESPPSSYMESLGGGKYAFRIYLTEGSGAVLGANVMNGHNVIFDIDGKRVGFVRSTCKYDAGPGNINVTSKNNLRVGKKLHHSNLSRISDFVTGLVSF